MIILRNTLGRPQTEHKFHSSFLEETSRHAQNYIVGQVSLTVKAWTNDRKWQLSAIGSAPPDKHRLTSRRRFKRCNSLHGDLRTLFALFAAPLAGRNEVVLADEESDTDLRGDEIRSGSTLRWMNEHASRV